VVFSFEGRAWLKNVYELHFVVSHFTGQIIPAISWNIDAVVFYYYRTLIKDSN
jgi:hypothetical protein